jgi:hypothetical protein
MKDLTPITPEALIEMGFVETKGTDTDEFSIHLHKVSIYVHCLKSVYVDTFSYVIPTNATTMEDIKDLIRLFK